MDGFECDEYGDGFESDEHQDGFETDKHRSHTSSGVTMSRVRKLRYVAALLALIVSGIHLFHPDLGFPRLVQHVQVGVIFDPRPLTFTVVGLGIVLGVLLVYNGVLPRRPVYLAGIVLMLTLLFGYVAWHTVLDHGGFWPHLPAHGHHDEGVVEAVLMHLADPLDFASKAAEFLLLVVLAVLYRIDR